LILSSHRKIGRRFFPYNPRRKIPQIASFFTRAVPSMLRERESSLSSQKQPTNTAPVVTILLSLRVLTIAANAGDSGNAIENRVVVGRSPLRRIPVISFRKHIAMTPVLLTAALRRRKAAVLISAGVLALVLSVANSFEGRVSADDSASPLKTRPLQAISLNIAPPGGTGADGKPFPLPRDLAAEQLALPPQPDLRPYPLTSVKAAGDWNFPYQPLLFEEANAERYGDVCPGGQPLVSAAKFYARTFTLPLTVLTTAPRKPQYFSRPDRPGYGGVREARW
jgi:hypothetical protein